MRNVREVTQTEFPYPDRKVTITGGGILGLLRAYYEFKYGPVGGVRVTVYEQNDSLNDTTVMHLAPSLTDEEMSSVIPPSDQLEKLSKRPFNLPGGGVNANLPSVDASVSGQNFIQLAAKFGQATKEGGKRFEALLRFGRASMALWQELYDEADEELKEILRRSNFNPCGERKDTSKRELHQGYRIDLIYQSENAFEKANAMKDQYKRFGYQDSRILSPTEVLEIDPSLAEFCDLNTGQLADGTRVWKYDAAALWRPGGCIDTATFLPLFCKYLEKVMGQYRNEQGELKNCFRIHYQRKVEELSYEVSEQDPAKLHINGLKFFGASKVKHNKHPYKKSDYTFCPGRDVKTLDKLGIEMPPSAGFAGASLKLLLDIPADKFEHYKTLNHSMQVHQDKDRVVVAWQARYLPDQNKVLVAIAGTKAFYADQTPNIQDEFAINRNLLQLNMINDVFPELISLALGRSTKGEQLAEVDMQQLEMREIAERWVGIRSLAPDGMPTVDNALYDFASKKIIDNADVTTHAGSGGVSFGPGLTKLSMKNVFNTSKALDPKLAEEMGEYMSSKRFSMV